MAKILKIPSFNDERGTLTVIDKLLPFKIRRVYYIYNSTVPRGFHSHRLTHQFLVSARGSCSVEVKAGDSVQKFDLNRPNFGLLLNPSDWHKMYDFSMDCLLLVLASQHYDENDYVR